MHLSGSVLVVGAMVVLATAACDSTSAHGTESAAREAKQFVCPSAAAVSSALGKTLPSSHHERVGPIGVACSYVDADATVGAVFVSVAFGVAKSQLRQIAGVATDSRRISPLSGVGDAALQSAADAKNGPMVFVLSGNRAVTVSVAEDGVTRTAKAAVTAEIVVARLYL